MKRHSDAETKAAAVAAVQKLESSGTPFGLAVDTTARTYGVTAQTLRNWLAGKHMGTRRQSVMTSEQLAIVFACSGNLAKAHELAVERGIFQGSLTSFRRRFKATDTDLAAAARDGIAAMLQLGLYNVAQGSASRGEIFHFDHTEIPVEVWFGTKRSKIWVSLVVDEGTGVIFRPTFTTGESVRGDPNTTSIIASVGGVMVGEELDDTMIGGIPSVFVFDNARAHLADAVMSGYASIGVATHTIRPGSPWENGTAEAAMRTVESEVWSQLPGYTHGPTTRYDKSPWADEELLSFEELVALTVVGIERINRSSQMSRHHGRTRLEAWRDDPRAIEFADASFVRHAFVATSGKRKVQKKGVFFQRRYYTSVHLTGQVGRSVEVRHIPGNENFIDVYLDGHFLCTARPHESQSIEDRTRLARTRTNRVSRAQVIQKRGAAAAREEAERQLIELQLKNLEAPATEADAIGELESDSPPQPTAFDAYLQRGTQ